MTLDTEQGWLIEQRDHFPRHRWLRLIWHTENGIPQQAKIDWTEDANLALRFARQQDAFQFYLLHPDECRATTETSHQFGLTP